MDPNTNSITGADPTLAGSAPEPTPSVDPGVNPAAAVANAAMAGATPVVTTTDLNAMDVAPEPTIKTAVLDNPILDTSMLNQNPVDDGPVNLAPSADFDMSEVSTVSAVQNGADSNLAAMNSQDDVMIGQPYEASASELPTQSSESIAQDGGVAPADFNTTDSGVENNLNEQIEEDEEPIVAAAPVPGSIGSAKSYSDIQRAEAEKAARAAAGKNTKMNKNTIILLAVVGVLAVIAAVFMIIIFSSGSTPANPNPTQSAYIDDGGNDDELSTLSCKRKLVTEEYISFGAVSGTQENIFYFRNEVLDGLATNFNYNYKDQNSVSLWGTKLAADYGVTLNAKLKANTSKLENDEELDEETDEEESEIDTEVEEKPATTSATKTAADMLHHYVTTDKLTVTHGMEILSEDINDWLASDAYSDVTYGAEDHRSDEEDVEEPVRNLDYYKTLQNNIDYDCEISKGY